MRRTLATAAVLLTALPAVFGQSPPSPAPASAAPQPTSKPSDVLNQMLPPGADHRRPLQPIVGDPPVNKVTVNPVDPRARPATLKREGGYEIERTGRATPSADGKSIEFNFEADAQAMQDPPMILLPNLALMVMQDQIRLSGRDLRFRVTGMVTEYMGRNYLMLQKVVVVNE